MKRMVLWVLLAFAAFSIAKPLEVEEKFAVALRGKEGLFVFNKPTTDKYQILVDPTAEEKKVGVVYYDVEVDGWIVDIGEYRVVLRSKP